MYLNTWIFIFFLTVASIACETTVAPSVCTTPLTATLRDDQFSSSSFYDDEHNATAARFSQGGWMAKDKRADYEYVRINFDGQWEITAMEFKRRGSGYYSHSSLRLTYSSDGYVWTVYNSQFSSRILGEDFKQEGSYSTKVLFYPTIQAQYIAFHPKDYAVLAVELYGCELRDSQSATSSPTHVDNLIDIDSTWTVSQSPFLINSPVTVKPGVTLDVQAGVDIVFTSINSSIEVLGTMATHGVPGLTVLLTSSNPVVWQPSQWKSVKQGTGGHLNIQHTVIRQGNYCVHGNGSRTLISSSDITFCDVGITLFGGNDNESAHESAVVYTNVIYSGSGLRIYRRYNNSYFSVRSSNFEHNNNDGIQILNFENDEQPDLGTDLRIVNCSISFNSRHGLYHDDKIPITLSVELSKVQNNKQRGVFFENNYSIKSNFKVNIMSTIFETNRKGGFKFYCFYCASFTFRAVNATFLSHDSQAVEIYNYFYPDTYRDEKQSLEIRNCKFTENKKDLELRLYPSGIVNVLNSRFTASSLSAVDIKMSSDAKIIGYVLISGNMFDGIFGKSYSDKSTIKVDNALSKIVFNSFTNTSTPNILHIGSGFNHTISHNRFINSSKSTCFVTTGQLFHPTQAIYADYNYWGSRDENVIRQKKCDFFINSKLAVINVSFYFLAEQLTDEQSSENLELFKEANAVGGENVTVIGGVVKQNTSVVGFDGNIMLNRSIIVLEGARLALGNVSVLVASERGIVVYGRLEDEFEKANEHNFFSIDSNWNGFSLYNASLRISNVNINGTQTSFNLFGKCEVGLDRIKAEDSSQESFMYVHDVDNSSITIANTLVKVKKHMLHLREDSTTKAMSVDLQLLNSTFANADRYNTLLYIRCCSCHLRIIAVGCNFSSMYEDTVYLHTLTLNMNANGNVFGRGKTNLDFQTCEHDNTSREVNITNNVFMSSSAGTNIFLHRQYGDSNRANHVFNIVGNKGTHSGLALRSFLKSDSYWYSHRHDLFLSSNTFEEFTKSVLEISSFFQNITIEKNIFVNNQRCLFYTGQHQDTFKSFEVKNNSFFNNSDNEGIVHISSNDFRIGEAKMQLNSFYNNTGVIIAMKPTDISLNFNVFENPMSIYNLKAIGMSEAVLNASYNFWDSLDKRLISNTIYDMSDDRELFSVTFEPYLASENVSDVYEDVQENNFVNENVIGGKVGGNVTLSLVDSPYILAFDVDVGINDTLTIDPGVKIGVKENRHINIFGTLTIRGTTDSPVVMVSEQNDVFWRGLTIQPSSVTSIEHLRMNATMTGFTVHEASVYLRNISSTYSQSAGISFIVSNELETDDFGDVSEVFVSNNKLGLKIQGTTTNSKSLAIRKCVVTDNNGTGIAVESDISIIISNCFIAHNNEKGVYIDQDRGGHFLMNESTIFNHSRKAIEGYLHGDITLDNCIIKGHKCGYFDYRQRWISLPSVLLQEKYPTVSHTIRLLSTRFENNLDEGVLVDFTHGSEVEVIVNNNTFVGGNRTLMFQGTRYWRSSCTMKFINNTIENNVLYSDISAFLTVDHTLLKEGFITENIFRNNKGPIGVKIKEDTEENCANIAINRNTFMDNTFASSHIHLLSTCSVSLNLNIFKEDENSCFLKVPEFAESKYVNATYNYWGTSNLSDAVERICGFDKDMRHLYVFYLPMFEDEGLQRLVLGENFSKDKLHSNGGYIEDDIEVSGVLSISRSIFVKTGSSFRIKPGSRLIFKENRGIYIKGSLQALSDNVSITFESEDAQRRWFGIYFNNSESGSIPSNIVNTHIMNTKFGLAIRSGVNVRRTLISNSSSDCLTILSSDGENVFDFENTTIEFCDNAGIAINSTLDGKGNTRIRNACIKNASIGFNTHTVYAVNMTLEQLDFRRCKKGLIINSYAENDNTTVRIVENNFTDIPSNVLLLNILPPKTVGNGVNKTFHISSNSFSNSCGINITTTAATIAAFANNLMRDSDCLSNNYCFFEVKSLNRTSFDMTANRFENINSSCIVKLGDGDHLRGKFIYNQLRNNFASTSTVVADTYDYDIFHNFFDNPSSVFEVLTTLQGSSYLNVTKNWWGRPDETYAYHRIHDKRGDSTLIRFNVTPVLTEREFDCHNVNNCSENGACAGPDYCSCISGWTGVSCSQHSCSELNNCYGNGVCVGPNDCSCVHGWTGKSCIEASCFNVGNCSDRGICIRPDVCQCAATFTGTDCTECKPFYWGSECRPCPNCHHGTCDMHSGLCNCEGDNWAGYLCDKCQETFYGVDCKPLMKVLQTLPSTGLDNGGYEVHIRGHNFPQSNDYFCKFGRTVSNGTWIGRTHVICAVPKHVEGRVYIEVSEDGQDYTDDKVSFNYYSTCPSTACGRELSPRHGQCLFGKCSCFLPWYGNNCTMKFLPPVILEPDQMQTSDESVFSYTKKMTLIQGDLPIRWLLLKGPESMDIEETSGLISWAPVVGRDTPYDIKIRAANNVGSDIADFSLMVSISYTAALQSIEPSGTFPLPRPVRIFGTVSPNAANRTLPVTLVVTGASTYRREVINVMTNLNDPGTFTCIYYPWADDVGSFTVTAHHPGRLDMSTGSISWSVLGMKCDPDTVRLTQEIENPEDTVLFQNVSFLTNSGDDPLYLITAEVIDFQDVFVHVNGTTNTSELVIEKLDPKEAIHFDVIFKNARPIRGSFLVVFSARDGTQTRLKVYITVSIQKPLLIFSPSSVEENVFRGTQKILDIIITNKGQIPADNISVSLPNDQRLSLVSITSINSSTGSSIGITVLTNEMAQMTLSFTTGPNENLGESFGTIALNTLRASFRLPYRFYISSNELFNVTVNIQDEYTYFADGSPLVSDAKVSLSNPRRGIYKVQVTSYETGFAIFRELYEDLYTLRVESDKHTTYNEIVLINEDTTVINVFLQRVAVKYTWTVEPTTFVDQYIVSLESTFETYVPMPVVTVEPAIIDTVPFEIGEKSVINFNVTNHGFIRADNVRFELPTNHPLLLFQSSLASIGDVDANTSVIVPVNITLRDRSKRSGRSVCGFVVLYDYVCGSTRTKGVQISLKNNYPGRPPTPCGNVWGFLIGGGGSSGSGGGGGVITYNPVTPLPCDCMKTLVKSCLLAFIPGVGCALSAEGYYNAVLSTLINIAKGSSLSDAGIGNVLLGMLDVFMGCYPGVNMSVGILYTYLRCLMDAKANCNTFRRRREVSSDVVNNLINTARPVENYIAISKEILGEEAWYLNSSWYTSFKETVGDGTPSGLLITNEEQSTVLDTLSNESAKSNLTVFLQRWNNTMASWQNGSLNEVEKLGHSFNLTLLTPKIEQTAHDMVTSKESGFQTIFDEFNQALKTYSDAEKKTRYDKNDGICARVRIKISQELVLTRDGFNARLEIENGEKSDLMDVKVDITIVKFSGIGEADNNLFSIGEPRLEELTAVDGSGRLTKGVSGTADWLIIPYSSAAPDADTLYDVGGTLSYSVDGTEFSTALLPDTIIVKPNPSLVVRYFHERYVRGDNPMTPDVEPIVPFSLAVVIMNQGNGVAQALKITSAQPEIIENEKGLLISFKIIGAQLGNESITPSLTVDFGDIYASETKTARWLMTSTLMGTFYNYSATFENINPLGDPQLSIIDKLDYHELFHSVRIVYPFGLDDGLDDFLVNDRVDQDGIPDRLYTSSDASVVFDVSHANISVINFTDFERSSKHHTNVTFEVTCTASGWIYARIFNSFSLDIIYAEETDVGRSLLIDKNIWTTTHITDDNLVHLVDKITEHDTVKCIKHYTVTFGIRNKFPPHANFTNNIQHFNISNRVNIGHTVVTFAIDDKDGDSVSAFVRNETTMEFVLRRISENKFSIQVSSVPPIGRYEIEIVMMDNGFPALTATDVVQINVMEVPFNVPDSSTIAQDTSPRTSATTFSNSTLTSTAQQTESSSTPKDKVSSSTIIRPSPCLLLGTVYVFIQYSVVITCFL